MFSKTLTVAAFAATLASAQTFTDCNPTKEDCPAAPAFGSEKVECDFTQGPCDAFEVLPGTTLDYDENGAVFSISKDSEAPTIATEKYLFFGRVEVVLQAAPGQGVVTSAVLQSDDLDEIDWEWLGGDNVQVQTNYFSKGDTTTFDRGAYHPMTDPISAFHTYTIEWTAEAINWMIDGVSVRVLTYNDAKGGTTFPQTPMMVKLGTWVAGRKGAPEGTVEWAGGMADFSNGPSVGYYKSISIVDYAGKSAPATGSVKEYVYGDRSGTWESIKVSSTTSDTSDKGEVDTGDDDEDSETATDASSRTTTEAADSTETGSDDEDESTTEAGMTTLTTPSAEGTTVPTPSFETLLPSVTGDNSAAGASDTPADVDAATRGSVSFAATLLAGAIFFLAQL